MDTEQIIQEYLEPRIPDECGRLGIPLSFIRGIYPGRMQLEAANCAPVRKDGEKNGEIIGVIIKLDYEEKRPRGARGSFFHEFKHAQKYYKREPQSDFEAYWYEIRRGIEEDCKTIVNKLKECILFLFNHVYL